MSLSELDRLHRGEYGGRDGSCPICAAEHPRGHTTGCPFHPTFELPKVSYSPSVHFKPIVLTLPFPPSVNHYWKHIVVKRKDQKTGKMYRGIMAQLSGAAERYRIDVQAEILQKHGVIGLRGRLDVHVRCCRYDLREYDIDNYGKGLLDAMEHAGVYQNDGQIDELHLRKIDLSDWVMVLNVDGYIGKSTAAEIAYAKSKRKMIVYLESEAAEAAREEGES